MNTKHITINLLPQSGNAWFCIMLAVVLSSMVWAFSSTMPTHKEHCQCATTAHGK